MNPKIEIRERVRQLLISDYNYDPVRDTNENDEYARGIKRGILDRLISIHKLYGVVELHPLVEDEMKKLKREYMNGSYRPN